MSQPALQGRRSLRGIVRRALGRTLLGRVSRRIGPERLLRSAGVRFGLIYAGLFGVSAVALAAFLWWSTAGFLERQTDNAINADSQGLSERYGAGGRAALIAGIEERLNADIGDDAIYLLADPAFHRVSGNLESWPAGVTMDVDWFVLTITRAGLKGVARVHHFDLADGYHLLIGRDVDSRDQLRGLLSDSMLWAALVAVILGSVGAWAVRGLFRATLADVSATALAVTAGDLSRRVKVTGSGDEFDLLAETINDMLDRIARLMDGVRQVSNAIAHDLRTPITRARVRLEDAATHATSEADLRAAVERAQADLDGIVNVFQALLRIAEIEAGARRSAFAVTDLAPMLTDLGELYEAAAEEQGLRLVTAVPAQLEVMGDRDMIQQAVSNLLDNAIKFSPPGSTVSLDADLIGTDQEAAAVRIAVADAGPGIPAEDRARATTRFFRGEQARHTPGSGLGLALVQAVATLHGGALVLEDAVAPAEANGQTGAGQSGKGLRAVLLLPDLAAPMARDQASA